MEDKDGVYGYAKYIVYFSFYIGGCSNDYTLHISGYSGPSNVGDSLVGGYNGHKFTNKNNDNNVYIQNCAVVHIGAWWSTNCHQYNRNGCYGDIEGIILIDIHRYVIINLEMKVHVV